jgi:hypothetical protein
MNLPPPPFEYVSLSFSLFGRGKAPFETMDCNNHCICLNMAMDHTFSNVCNLLFDVNLTNIIINKG